MSLYSCISTCDLSVRVGINKIYNLNNQNKQQMSDKTFFGCIDHRNAKFQGSIKDGQPNGLGIALNQDCIFALSNWKQDQLSGPSFIVFSNRDYFYGKVKNRQPDGVCVYVKASGKAIFYVNFDNRSPQKIAVLDESGLLTQLVPSEEKWNIGSTTSLKKNETNKWDAISKCLGTQIPKDMKSLRIFLNESLGRLYIDTLQIIQSSGTTFVGFKNSASLGLKFDRQEKIRQVGNYETFPRNLQFGRKYIDSVRKSIKIQEGRFAEPEKVFVYEGKRPLDATKYTEDYFKRGTNFKNTFFKMQAVDQLESSMKTIERQAVHLSILQYGQKILQCQVEQQQMFLNKQYKLEEVRDEIYAAVHRRNTGRRTDRSITQSRKSPEQIQKTPFSDFNQEVHNRDLSSGRKRSNPKRYIYTETKQGDRARDFPSHHRTPLNQFTLYQEPVVPVSSYVPHKLPLYEDPLLKNLQPQENILLRRRQEVLKDLNQLRRSPIKQIYAPGNVHKIYHPDTLRGKRDISPYRPNTSEHQENRQTYDYPHLNQYKNRSKTPTRNLTPAQEYEDNEHQNSYFPNKHTIYERKATGHKTNYEKELPKEVKTNAYYQRTISPIDKINITVIPSRHHKKNFKYL